MAIIKAAENKVNKVLFTVEAAAPKYQMRIAINTIPTTSATIESTTATSSEASFLSSDSTLNCRGFENKFT